MSALTMSGANICPQKGSVYYTHPPTATMQNTPVARPISTIHDIIVIICGFAEKSDLVNVLTVSHSFFRCAAPQIWKDVPGIKPLFNLLPDVKREVQRPEMPVAIVSIKPVLCVVNHEFDSRHRYPQQMNQDQLSRFDTYAHLVKTIDLDFALPGAAAQCGVVLTTVLRRPLLPNLRELAVYAPPWQSQSSEIVVICAEAFLCTTLAGLRMSRPAAVWLNPWLTARLLQNMSNTSPNIETLEIFPGSKLYPKNVLEQGEYSDALLFAPIALFQNLRVLNSSSALLDPEVLQSLGSLPQLESIAIHTISVAGWPQLEHEMSAFDLDLPAHSFPALRHLGIGLAPPSVISKLWCTSALVCQLVSIHIVLCVDTEDSLYELVCAIFQGSPQLIEIDLRVPTIGLVRSGPPRTVLGYLRLLPLQRLRITGTNTWGVFGNLEHLALALPNVVYLDVPEMWFDFDDFLLVAKHMPRLQYLAVGAIASGSWPTLPGTVLETTSPSTFCLAADFHYTKEECRHRQPNAWHDIAR
jgi:hypothetical protein